MLRRRVIWGLDQGTNAQQLGNIACGSATRPQAHSEDVRSLEEATLDCISVLIPALKLTYHGRFHRSCVSWGLQLGNLAFSGVLVSGAGLEPLGSLSRGPVHPWPSGLQDSVAWWRGGHCPSASGYLASKVTRDNVASTQAVASKIKGLSAEISLQIL